MTDPPRILHLAALAAVNAAVWILISRAAVAGSAVASLWGLPGMVWYAALPVGTAVVVGAVSRPSIGVRRALFVALLATPVLMLVLRVDPLGITASVLIVALVLAVTYRLSGRLQWRAGAAAGICAVCFFWLDAQLYVDASIFYPVEDSAAAAQRGEWEASEQILFDQADMIDAVVASMAPRAPSGSSFLVGFAGYGEEKVFAEEIRFAARVLGERYDALDRSLLLINDRRDRTSYPLASAAGLNYGVSRIAERMDVDTDLLVLLLSSHGSDEPLLAVSNAGVPLRDLDASLLRSALDEAGIRWRLIIISACHAGAFIERLAAPGTAVLTAAAADRTSFGCSNSRDLTYFGEHFYRDALPGAESLRIAFDRAGRAIAERAEGLVASNPQAYFGEGIEQKLDQVMRRPTTAAD